MSVELVRLCLDGLENRRHIDRVLRLDVADREDQCVDGRRCVADDADVCTLVLVDLRLEHVDAHDLALSLERVDPEVGLAELRADHEQHLCGLRNIARCFETQVGAERERVVLVEHALAVGRGHDGCAELLGERLDSFGSAARAATGEDHRVLCALEQRRALCDSGGVELRGSGSRNGLEHRALKRGLGLEHVERNLDVDGAGATCAEQLEGVVHCLHCLFGRLDATAPLDDSLRGRQLVFRLVQCADICEFSAAGDTRCQQDHGA